MKKISLLTALIFFVLNSSALAVSKNNLPVYDDFNNFENEVLNQYKTGYSASVNNAKKHAAKFENGKIKADINIEEGGSLKIAKKLESPFVGESFSFEYDFLIEGDSYLYSYVGLPVIVDSKGTETPLIKVTNAKQGYTVPGDRAINVKENSLKNMEWQAGTEYKIKIDVNLSEKNFNIYIDSGCGYEKKETESGEATFKFKGENILEFYFTFLGNSSNTATYYIDNLKITTPYEYIYVSEDGDDENDGSYETPVKTLKKAYSMAAERKTINNKHVFVRVKSGEYSVDESYTLGDFSEDSEYGNIAFAPDNNADVSLSGDFLVDIPELEDFRNEELKTQFIKDIKNEYISGYNTTPLEVSNLSFAKEEDGTLSSSMWLSNSGRVNKNVCLLAAIYNKSGMLEDVTVNNVEVLAGESVKATVGVLPEEKYDNYTVKTYLWQDFESMRPILNMQLSSELDVNIKNSSIYDVKTVLNGEQIDFSSKAEPGSFVSLKMTNESGKIVYLNQIPVDENGEVSYNINPEFMPAGVVTLHIQSNGGVKNE